MDCILYTVLYIHTPDYSVTTNLYFLIHSPFIPSSSTLIPSGNHQKVLCIYESVSVLHAICFLDLIIDRYVFIAILLLIYFILFLFLSS